MDFCKFGMGRGMFLSVQQMKSQTSILMDKLQNDGFNCQTHNDMCFNVLLGTNKVVSVGYIGVGYNVSIDAINFSKVYDTYPKLVAALKQYERS